MQKKSFAMLALTLGMGIALESRADTWFGYCWAQKANTHICKAPELRDDDFDVKCRDFARSVNGVRWGSRYGTSLGALEASMGEHCDQIHDQQGQIYTCSLEAQCPETSAEGSRLTPFGNRVYALDQLLAVDRCSEINQHRVMNAVGRYSKADCFVKLLAQPLE